MALRSLVASAAPAAARVVGFVLLASSTVACGGPAQPRYALRDPVTKDKDLEDKRYAPPAEYTSSFAWDAADNSIFRPVSKFFWVSPGGEALNVNAFDEVPDSSWFTNRIGVRPMSSDEIINGPCQGGPQIDPDDEDGSWFIDHGKDNGANPGFRVKSKGMKYMLKADDSQKERATAATAIAARLYYAAGWFTPCDSVVYFRRSILKLKPGLTVKANTGGAKPFDEGALQKLLDTASRRGELYRVAASRWLPGEPLGPFRYESTRDDDPNDVINHQDRRDLRGARIIAAWLNHFDSREQNSMDTWIPSKDDPRAGHVQHWYIDLGDSFGSEWTVDGFSRRHGFTFALDIPDMAEDFVTLGIPQRPWDRAHKTPGAENFGYFSSRDFEPESWKGEYPNPTFARTTEHDAAWAARIIARITPANIADAVSVGKLSSPFQTEWLTNVIVERRQILLRRYFAKLSPLTDVKMNGNALCAVDLGRTAGVFEDARYKYTADIKTLDADPAALVPEMKPGDQVCVPLPSLPARAGAQPGDRTQYRIVRIHNGTAKGALEIHLYDLGAAGWKVVGIERPTS